MSLGGGASLTTDAAVAGLYESGVFVSVSAGNEATDACNQSPARAEKVSNHSNLLVVSLLLFLLFHNLSSLVF